LSPDFSVSEHDEGSGVVVLTVAGDIDEQTEDALITVIVNALAGRRVTELIVDLEHVTFLGSCGIRALLVGRDDALQRGTTLRVRNPSGMTRRVLEITNVIQVLNVTQESDTGRAVGSPAGLG
jgi:anti-sigma B factor antagonist